MKMVSFILYHLTIDPTNSPYEERLQIIGVDILHSRRKRTLFSFEHKILINKEDCSAILELKQNRVLLRSSREKEFYFPMATSTETGS